MESTAHLDYGLHARVIYGVIYCIAPYSARRWRPSGFAPGINGLGCDHRVLYLGSLSGLSVPSLFGTMYSQKTALLLNDSGRTLNLR